MNQVRVGVIGLGEWGEVHLAAYKALPFVEVVAVGSRTPERAQQVAEKYHVPKWYTDVDELTNDSDIEAVSVVTREDDHLRPTLSAIGAGKHVLVEKPIATTLEEAEQMVSAARQADVILMPAHVLRFDAAHALLKDRLETGQLGEIVSIYARRNPTRTLGSKFLRVHPTLVTSIHDMDMALWYTGAKVRRVRAMQRKIQGGEFPDAVWALMELTNGVVFCLETVWILPDSAPLHQDSRAEVIGTEGVAYLSWPGNDLEIWGKRAALTDVTVLPTVRGNLQGAIREELAYFATCVMRGEKPKVVSPEEAVEGLRAILALIASAETNREVILTEA